MRIAALDFGLARIGLAISDENKKIALPRSAITAQKNLELTAQHVAKELQALGPLETILLGLPLHLNGKESPMSQEVRKFAQILQEKYGLPILLRDERLTSAMGERLLKDAEVKHTKRKEVIDGISAAILLQNYLDSQSRS